jgi:hypothetical protein
VCMPAYVNICRSPAWLATQVPSNCYQARSRAAGACCCRDCVLA